MSGVPKHTIHTNKHQNQDKHLYGMYVGSTQIFDVFEYATKTASAATTATTHRQYTEFKEMMKTLQLIALTLFFITLYIY